MKRFSLGRFERNTRTRDFQKIFSQGNKVVGKVLILYFAEEESPVRKLGVIVTKKMGNAVVRNSLKRKIKEAFRINKECFPSGTSIVVISRTAAKTASFSEIEQDLVTLAKQKRVGS
ncbi:MAG: ribonuclease P protein component [Candidatus Theseobacter exili]|nr:ribonuclease P protein component [Candidatus Theseobacter exili]